MDSKRLLASSAFQLPLQDCLRNSAVTHPPSNRVSTNVLWPTVLLLMNLLNPKHKTVDTLIQKFVDWNNPPKRSFGLFQSTLARKPANSGIIHPSGIFPLTFVSKKIKWFSRWDSLRIRVVFPALYLPTPKSRARLSISSRSRSISGAFEIKIRNESPHRRSRRPVPRIF